MAERNVRVAVTVLRASVASVFVIHGAARVLMSNVAPFGVFHTAASTAP